MINSNWSKDSNKWINWKDWNENKAKRDRLPSIVKVGRAIERIFKNAWKEDRNELNVTLIVALSIHCL